MGRHSSMVVGPTGGGKTVIIEILCMAQTYLNVRTKLYILNPKVYIYIYYMHFYFIIIKIHLLASYFK